MIDSPIPGTRCAPDLTLYLLGENGRPLVTASHVFASIEVKRGNHLAGAEEAVLAEKQKYITSTTRYFYLVDQRRVIGYQVHPGGEMVKRKIWTWTKLAQDDVFKDAFFPISAEFARVGNAIEAFKGGHTGFAYVDVTDDSACLALLSLRASRPKLCSACARRFGLAGFPGRRRPRATA